MLKIQRDRTRRNPLYGYWGRKSHEILDAFVAGEDLDKIIDEDDAEVLSKFLEDDIIRIKE